LDISMGYYGDDFNSSTDLAKQERLDPRENSGYGALRADGSRAFLDVKHDGRVEPSTMKKPQHRQRGACNVHYIGLGGDYGASHARKSWGIAYQDIADLAAAVWDNPWLLNIYLAHRYAPNVEGPGGVPSSGAASA